MFPLGPSIINKNLVGTGTRIKKKTINNNAKRRKYGKLMNVTFRKVAKHHTFVQAYKC
jgi:hypothetical protein